MNRLGEEPRRLLTLIKHEFLTYKAERWILVSCLALFCILAAEFIFAARAYREIKVSTEVAQAAAHENWLNQGDRDPHGAAHHGTYLYSPVSPLAGVDPGMTPHLGSTLRIEAHVRHHLTNAADSDWCNPIRQTFRSPATTVYATIPLLAIAVGFASVSQERASGTLSMILVQGVPWRALLLGKVVAATSLIMVTISPFFLSIAYHLYASFSLPNSETLGSNIFARSVLMCFATLIYVVIWSAICTATSARVHSSGTALVALLGLWLTMVFLLPTIATQIASATYPLPSQETFKKWADDRQYIEKDGQSKSIFMALHEEVEQQLFTKYGVTNKKDLPVNFDGVFMQEAEKFTDKLHAENEARLRVNLQRQACVVDCIGAISPFHSMRGTSMALTMTDLVSHEHLSDQAEKYRQHLVAVVNAAYAIKSSQRSSADQGGGLWKRVGRFGYELPRLAFTLRSQGWQLVILTCWLIIAMCFLWWTPSHVT